MRNVSRFRESDTDLPVVKQSVFQSKGLGTMFEFRDYTTVPGLFKDFNFYFILIQKKKKKKKKKKIV